jgi:hypothetical protein
MGAGEQRGTSEKKGGCGQSFGFHLKLLSRRREQDSFQM